MTNMKTTKILTQKETEKQYEYMSLINSRLGDAERKVYIQTFGCQQNEADSEILAGMAIKMGYSITDTPADASLILVNTCAIREHAELKALSITGQFKHLKAANPALMIGICGCMVTQEHRMDDIKHKYPYVDFLFGTSMLYRFPEVFYEALCANKRIFRLDDDYAVAEGLPVRRESGFKAWVSIMYGCNNFCTYCVVPYVRGRERSRKPADILAEIKELVDSGYKEITLLGQNVNSYGKDLEEVYDFADLLKEAASFDGEYILRFMTSHPKDASEKLINVMAENPKIAKQFHLPLQAGSTRVLTAMNRRYTKESYLSLIKLMRSKMPDIALSTDIIVGFPTETAEEFEETLEVLREVSFDSIYSFIYSRRKGTPAAEMDGQIEESEKSRRFEALLALQNEISKNKNLAYEGKTIKVLTEGRSKTDDTKLTGRNEKNRLVHFEGPDSLIGKFCNVKIDKAETYALYGTLDPT